MSIFTEAEAKAILDKVIKLSKADECTATLTGSTNGNVRFALNNVTTSGIVDNIDLGVQVAFGKRVGTATINSFDDASLERVVRRAEDLARLAPENPEFMPAIAKQEYKPTPTFDAGTAGITPEFRAKVAADSIAPCRSDKLVAAGFLSDNTNFFASANSNGNFCYQQATNMDYTCTVRTEDGRGSGWVARNLREVGRFDAGREIRTAIRKAKDSAEAKALEPGKYTVILEPAASAGLISFMMFSYDARQADEGRSFLSKKGGGNKLGEQVYDPRVSIWTDPWDAEAAVYPWDEDGLPREKMPIIDKGKVSYLQYSRYWAQQKGKRAVGQPGNLIMAGGDKSTADLIKGTEKGVLVTRTWYIRMVDPQTVLLTGLTRDGTFYIENGEIKYPVKNFRFNESPVIMLNNIEELGKPVRVGDDESPFVMMIPPMKLRDFTFTSLSDAV
ncbi:TldD/PmbA family protein [Lysobacter niabensis]|uniref:TldD/PmbA family protein n=1 Tax=Agrilutibacter niabensis TaxID=380628 RepID=UPI003620FA81